MSILFYVGFIKDITTNATVLNVVELTPYSRYIFSITTENEMLYQEIDVNYRTSYMTVTTEEGGIVIIIIGRVERALLVAQIFISLVRQSTAHAPCSRNMVQRSLD